MCLTYMMMHKNILRHFLECHSLLFFSSYSVVLLLGFQSQIVRDKHVFAAFITSLMIGTCQLVLFKLAPNASTLESIILSKKRSEAGESVAACGLYLTHIDYNWNKLTSEI